MKNKVILISALLVSSILLGGLGVWYFSPEKLLKGTPPEDVATIYVFNGSTGRRFTVSKREEIDYIVSNIRKNEYKKDGVAVFIDGYGFSISLRNADGAEIDSIIVNSPLTIRDSVFFYRSADDVPICYEYLSMLEAKYSSDVGGELPDGKRWFCAEITEVSESSVMVMPDSETWEVGCAADVGIRVTTRLEGEGSVPELSEGDRVKIVYDGRIAESFPCQILTVYSIEKI